VLLSLKIQNLAVIDEITINFKAGFNVLTGETGVGKSMVVVALDLLVGGRGSPFLIRTGEEEGSVEAIFFVEGQKMSFKRVISRKGKTRSYLNGKAIPQGELSGLCRRLLDIYGQEQHYLLRDPETHLEVFDRLADLIEERQNYRRLYENYLELERKYQSLKLTALESKRKREFILYQLNELENAQINPEEEEKLTERRKLLLERQKLLEALSVFKEEINAVLKGLKEALRILGKIKPLDLKFEKWTQTCEEAKAPLEELGFEAEKFLSQLELDPQELDRIENRLFQLQRLKEKYGAKDLKELLEIKKTLTDELKGLEKLEERLKEVEREKQALGKELLRWAEELSERRAQFAQKLSLNMKEALKELGMPNASFSFVFRPPKEGLEIEGIRIGPFGKEEGEFLLSANPGEEARPLWAVASGGELSRTMLALKNLSLKEEPKVLVFDEIDTGIGGITAQVVGNKLKELAKRHQLLCVTHLPQIAAKADHHLRVRKEVVGGRTKVIVEEIQGEERKWEIARMLAGTAITPVTLKQAEELILQG
jgi:DNA repair protein RecN (Recombination protein N)